MNMNHGTETHEQPLQDELDIIGLFCIIWKFRIFIAVMVMIPALAAAIMTAPSITPKVYRAEAVVTPLGEGGGQGGGLSSSLNRFSGLASMAGIKIGGDSNTEQNLAILESREFLMPFIKKYNLSIELTGEKEDNIWEAYRILTDILDVNYDDETSLITVAIVGRDPEKAAFWVNSMLKEVNEYVRAKEIQRSQKNLEYLNKELLRTRVDDFRLALYGLIAQEQKKAMLANTQTEYVFRMLDKAMAPDKKVGPKRTQTVIVAMLLGLLLSLIVVFLREVIRNTMEKRLNNISG